MTSIEPLRLDLQPMPACRFKSRSICLFEKALGSDLKSLNLFPRLVDVKAFISNLNLAAFVYISWEIT